MKETETKEKATEKSFNERFLEACKKNGFEFINLGINSGCISITSHVNRIPDDKEVNPKNRNK